MAQLRKLTERAFVERCRPEWTELETIVHAARTRGIAKLDPKALARLSPLYRNACADMARAKSAGYTQLLGAYLGGLVADAHSLLYGPQAGRLRRTARAESPLTAFPRAVRARHRAVLLASALFFVPFFVALAVTLVDPSFAFRVAPESMLKPLTESYAQGFSQGRGTGQSVMMAGFYVNNNIGIALRCFALGVFGGLGSAIYLVQNGLSIGAIVGYVASQGAGDNILTFIVGHGAFELGAIVIAGGAGLSLGWSIVAPGAGTRLESVRAASKDIFVLVAGAAVMLTIAAMIEAFWSPSALSDTVKRVVGAVFHIAVVLYLVLAGRGTPAPEPEVEP